jgi:hypothetical protein
MANIFIPDFLRSAAEQLVAQGLQVPQIPNSAGALESLNQPSTPMGMLPYGYDGPVYETVFDRNDTAKDDIYRPPPPPIDDMFRKDEPYRPPPVPDWYRETLGRAGDEGGMSYWEGRLAAGEDPTAVYNQFLGSAQEEINRRPVPFEQSQVPINGTGGWGGEYDQGDGTKYAYIDGQYQLVPSDYRFPQPVYPDTGFNPPPIGPYPPEVYRATGLDPFVGEAEDRRIDPRKFRNEPFTGYELPVDFRGFGDPLRQPENPSDHRYVPGQDDGFGLPIMGNPYGDRQIGGGPRSKEEREAMPDLVPDLSMIPPPEYRPGPGRGLLGSNSDAGKLYDLYNKFNLDRINNAKRLGVNNEGLKKILGEDLYNKYRNLR